MKSNESNLEIIEATNSSCQASSTLKIEKHEEVFLKVLPNSPLFISDRLTQSGICLHQYRQPAWEIRETLGPHHTLHIIGNNLVRHYDLKLDGRKQSLESIKNHIVIEPANITHQSAWDNDVEFCSLFLDPSHLCNIAHESIDADSVEIIPTFAMLDPSLYQVCMQLKSELQLNQLCNRLYVDSLVTILSINLIRHYSTQKYRLQEHSTGLPTQKLRQIIDYIHENIGEDLTLKNIAAQFEMSSYYFTRLFKKSTGTSTHQYVINRRIDKAKQLLAKQNISLTQISLQVGFQDQSHFINTFRKRTGMTPLAYRKASRC
jgi:AraC family transcriptional regulator